MKIKTLLRSVTCSLLGILSFAPLRIDAAPPSTPSFASDYQLVWLQDFAAMTTTSQVGVVSGYTLGSGTWISHTPNHKDWFTFIDPSSDYNPFAIANGYLTIRVAKRGYGDPNNWFSGYSGGLLSSIDQNGNGFAQKYGYFECSMQTPGGPNTWPAFWLLGKSSVTNPTANYAEIDVTESYGNYNSGPNQTPPGNPNWTHAGWIRWGQNGTILSHGGHWDQIPGLSTGFHTYGVNITPDLMTFYVDRVQVYQTSTFDVAHDHMYVLVNLALGGASHNNSDGTGYNWNLTPDPSDMKVKYVAVWASPHSPNYTGAPAAPSGLAATAGNGQVALNWTAGAGATSYSIYRGTSVNGQSTTAIATGVTATSYTNTGLTNGTTYYYKVKAVNATGTSADSNEASATPSTGGGGGSAIVGTSFSFSGSRQPLNGTQLGLTSNLSGGNWVWGAGWNWGAPYIPATWDPAPQAIANLAEEKTVLAISLASAGSYTKPTQLRISADLRITGSQGGGLGFWSTIPARADGGTSLTGFTGLNLRDNGNLQLYANGATVGSAVATISLTAGTFYNLAYTVDTATGAISNIVFNGNAVAGISSTAFTNAATAFAGAMSATGGRTSMRAFTVTPVSGGGTPFTALATSFTSTGSKQTLPGTITGLTTNLPTGNWIWGAGWNWGSPFIPATWDAAPINCADLAEEKTVLAHSLASSGSYTKPTQIRISASITVTGAEGGGLGFWSSIPTRADGGSSLTGFTGLNVKLNGNLQLYANGAVAGSPVATSALTVGTFYPISYDVNTATGAISNVQFNGNVISGFSTTAFTNAATAFAGAMSHNAGRTKVRNFTVGSW